MDPRGRIRQIARSWIEDLEAGALFYLNDLYRFLKRDFRDLCDEAGLSQSGQPEYQHYARFAVQDCKGEMLLIHAGVGRWQRVKWFR